MSARSNTSSTRLRTRSAMPTDPAARPDRRGRHSRPGDIDGDGAASIQRLAILLEGITPGDYLESVIDPEPAALGGPLRKVTVDADLLGDRIDVQLHWDAAPPFLEPALALAGFPVTPEVRHILETSTACSAASSS